MEESFQRYFPLVLHLLCIKDRNVSILLHSVIQNQANHCCWGGRQPVGNSLFKRPSCCLFTCHCPDWSCLVTLEKGYGEKRQVSMTKELQDNAAMSWAWVEPSWSNLGSGLLSTALVTSCDELWAETAKPGRWPSASEQVGWELHSTFASPKPSSAAETDLDTKFKFEIFQTARKPDGLEMKRLGLEQLSQAAVSSFSHPDVPRQRKTPLSKNLHIYVSKQMRGKIEKNFFKVKSTPGGLSPRKVL